MAATKRNNNRKKKNNNSPLTRILLVILVFALIGTTLYFTLDFALKYFNKQQNKQDDGYSLLLEAIDDNKYEKAALLYSELLQEDSLKEDNHDALSEKINEKFNKWFQKDSSASADAYNTIKQFSFYVNKDNLDATLTDLYVQFQETDMTYEKYNNSMSHVIDLLGENEQYKQMQPIISLHEEKANSIRVSREEYRKANDYENNGDFINAYTSYLNVIQEDIFYFENAQQKAILIKENIKSEILTNAKTFELENDYENAYYILKSVPEILKDDPELSEYMSYITDKYLNSDLVGYKGVVYNMFFHSLAIFPDKAFSSSRGKELFDIMATKLEFEKTIQYLYDNNFILINASDIYTIDNSKTIPQLIIKDELMLPAGKKPLLLSFDNLACTHWAVGFCKKLIIDDNGRLASVIDIDGVETITYDDEHVLILHDFVKRNPDFSFNNALATIGMSGYESMFGYNTADMNYPNRDAELKAAKQVADKLIEMGYVFANHSFYHFANSLDIPSSYTDLEWLKMDTEKWIDLIQPVLGPTNIYITPGGKNYSVAKYIDGDRNDPLYNYLVSKGYQIILSVGRGQFYTNNVIGNPNARYFYGTSLFMDRFNIDGKSLYKPDSELEQVFGFKYTDILDSVRHKYEETFGTASY